MNGASYLKLIRFFASLSLKEHLYPALKTRPLVAELFLTQNCNLRCISCTCWRKHTDNELSTYEWKDVIRQLATLGFIKLNFNGGEALTRPDLLELMQYAGKISGADLHLATNGILLEPAIQKEIIAAGVRNFNVSLDGSSADIHDMIRGQRGAFHRTTTNLFNLIALRNRYGLNIRICFTVMRDNIHDVPNMVAFAREMRTKLYLNLVSDRTFLFRHQDVSKQMIVSMRQIEQMLQEIAPLVKDSGSILPRFSDLAYVRKHFSDIIQHTIPCAESQLKVMIRSDGGLGGCWGHDPVTSVRTVAIRDFLDSPFYHRQQAAFFRKQCTGCGSNYSLNQRWRPSTYCLDFISKLKVKKRHGTEEQHPFVQ